jgi:heme-degrading monooxygenase HmoA
VEAARQAPGCIDFVVAADPLDGDRVNVFEEWESAAHLQAFRGEGPEDDLASLIARAEVQERMTS